MQNVHANDISTSTVATFDRDNSQPADLMILREVFPSGQAPDWYISPEVTLDLVKGFEARYQELQELLQSGNYATGLLDKARKLSSDLFAAWGISSRCVLDTCGVGTAIEMLELFADNRELYWGFESSSSFNRLDDRITIFRGGSGCSAEVSKGFSWSLFESMAEMFAGKSGDPVLLQAEVDKDDVLLINFDAEMEIVPRPGSIRNIVQLEARGKAPVTVDEMRRMNNQQ